MHMNAVANHMCALLEISVCF